VEEAAAAVDALSAEAAGELLRSLALSGPATLATSALRALEPLRPPLPPLLALPSPLEIAAALAPAVELTASDREALESVRALLALAQRAAGAAAASASSSGGGGGGAGRAAAAALGRAAGELSPLLPELAPGLAHTGQLLLRALSQRAAARIAGGLSGGAGAFLPGASGVGAGRAPAPAFSFQAPPAEPPAAGGRKGAGRR